MKKDYQERVVKIVEKVTRKKIENIDFKGDLRDNLHIDSIQVVELFAALEKEFSIELPLQLMTVKTAEEFMNILIAETEKVSSGI